MRRERLHMFQKLQDELMHKGCIRSSMQLLQHARLLADVCMYRRSLQQEKPFLMSHLAPSYCSCWESDMGDQTYASRDVFSKHCSF